jgi:hypothetical protein
MPNDATRPFDSIESTLEYMILLEASIVEASREIEDGMDQARDPRSMQGWALAQYKMRQLLFHTQKSRRLLNDLRLIRGVMAGPPDSEPVPADRSESLL